VHLSRARLQPQQ